MASGPIGTSPLHFGHTRVSPSAFMMSARIASIWSPLADVRLRLVWQCGHFKLRDPVRWR